MCGAPSARRPARRLPLEGGRDECRNGDPGLFQRPADVDDLFGLHGEQVATAHGAHVEMFQPVFLGEGDHLVERRPDFIADDGELEAGERHAATLLWHRMFG
jgi:hypothetical protein